MITVFQATSGSGLIPHGGGAIAILIAGIVVAVIAAVVAIEQRRNMFGWMAVAFAVTVVVVSLANYVLS